MKHFCRHFFSSDRYPLLCLAAVWVVVQIFLLTVFGIETGYEAAKYIEQANHLLQTGTYVSKNFIFYSTEIVLIVLAMKLHTGFLSVVLAQLALNATSLLFFYKLILFFTKTRKAALIFSLALLSMIYYQLYNVFLFTESVFFSISILYTFFLFSVRRITIYTVVLTLLMLGVLILTRPTGLLFIPPTVIYMILKFGSSKKLLLTVVFMSGGFVGFYTLLNQALGSGGEFDFLIPYVQEHIICGVATIQQPHIIKMPVNQNSIEGLLYIVRNNSDLFFQLALKRFLTFWNVQRPYYSASHNIFIAVYFYTLYVFILAGTRKMFSHYLPEGIFLLTYILSIMLTVVLSCDEWHNRFIFSILPFLVLLAAGSYMSDDQKTIST